MDTKYAHRNNHMFGTISPKRRLGIQERRRKILAMIQNDPGIRQEDMAKKLKCDRGTVSRDLKAMSEEVKLHNTDAWMLQRDRVLSEIHEKKALCEDRLQRLSKKAHQGSRWMEEWQKLLDKEARILGLYAPDRLLIKQEQTFDKKQEDASIDAMMKAAGAAMDIIDLVPINNKPVKQLPEPEKLN